jgi:hypothetical protein
MKPAIPSARVSVTDDEARAAVLLRPDLAETERGRRALAAAWEVGPAAVLALCTMDPTPDALSDAERERQRKLRFDAVKLTAARAFDAIDAIEGTRGDATRREVYEIAKDMRPALELLAAWWQKYERGERAPDDEFKRVVRAAETVGVREALVKTNNLVDQAIADANAKITEKKAKRRPKP